MENQSSTITLILAIVSIIALGIVGHHKAELEREEDRAVRQLERHAREQARLDRIGLVTDCDGRNCHQHPRRACKYCKRCGHCIFDSGHGAEHGLHSGFAQEQRYREHGQYGWYGIGTNNPVTYRHLSTPGQHKQIVKELTRD